MYTYMRTSIHTCIHKCADTCAYTDTYKHPCLYTITNSSFGFQYTANHRTYK